MNTFKMYPARRDRDLMIVAFVSGPGHAGTLLRAVSSNAHTGYVREVLAGATIPKHAAEQVAEHLVKLGWQREA